MADYTYRIYAAANNVAPNFTTIDAAVADAVANDRTGSGTNGRIAASSTLYIKIDGFLSLTGGTTIVGIDTATNSGAAIVVEAYSNRWNATPRAIGYTSSFDGIDSGNGAQFAIGLTADQGAVTVRNLVIVNDLGTYAPLHSRGTNSKRNSIENCVIRNAAATGYGVYLDNTNIKNCLVLLSTGAGSAYGIESVGDTTAVNVDQCVFASLVGGSTLCLNQNDPLPIIRNSYVGGFTTFSTFGNFLSTCVGNATSQASWTGPTGTLTSVTLSTTNFQNVTSGTEDFRAKATSVLKTTGATRLAGVLTDIFGTSRLDPTTIGAFAAEAATAQSANRNGIALASISAINGITKASVSHVNGLTI